MVGLKKLALPGSLWTVIEADVRKKYPQEACGLLAGCCRDNVYQAQAVFPMENILHSSNRFRLDPQQQIDRLFFIQSQNLELIAIYHSHPQGGIKPSETDRVEAYDPGVVTLIWHPAGDRWECRAYIFDTHGFEEIPIDIQQAA